MDSSQSLSLALLGRANSFEELADELSKSLLSELWQRSDILWAEPDGSLILKASTDHPEYIDRCRLGAGIGLSGRVFLSQTAVLLSGNAQLDSENLAYPGVDEKSFATILSEPLVLDGKCLGVLNRYSDVPVSQFPLTDAISPEATWCAELLFVFLRATRIGAHSDRIGALSQVSKTIASSPYLDEILQLLVNITAQQFNYAVCTVRLLDERRGELVLRATQAPAKAYQRKPAIKFGESIAGRAIVENRAIFIPDVLAEPDYIGHDLAAEQGLRSMICVPLSVQDKPIGAMSCYTREVRAFTEDEIRALETIAKQAAFSIEHAKLQVRSTLMQEMHHRVKNNLQQVASLIRLQINHPQDKPLQEALSDTLARILAISSVHDLLSRDDLDHVGIRSVAESLVQHHRDSLLSPELDISFDVRGDDFHLGILQATQVSLLLNELLQNAIEHGFRSTQSGEVHVTIEKNDSEVGLWVSNSGDPLPSDFSTNETQSLGLKLVESLTRSLGGQFKISMIHGWVVAESRFTQHGPE